jgi:hypothetical protein
VPFRKKWAPRAHFSSWGNVVFEQDSTSVRGRFDAIPSWVDSPPGERRTESGQTRRAEPRRSLPRV